MTAYPTRPPPTRILLNGEDPDHPFDMIAEDDAYDELADSVTATYGEGGPDECLGCGHLTTGWVHAMTSYPLFPSCYARAVAEQEGE